MNKDSSVVINEKFSITTLLNTFFSDKDFSTETWTSLPANGIGFEVDKHMLWYNANKRFTGRLESQFLGSKVFDIYVLDNNGKRNNIDAVYLMFEPNNQVLDYINEEIGLYSSASGFDVGFTDKTGFSDFSWTYKGFEIVLSKHQLFTTSSVISAQNYFDISITKKGISGIRGITP